MNLELCGSRARKIVLVVLTSPHVTQDLPFGERNLVLSNGEIIKTPNVIRMVVKQRAITHYVQYCEENDFKPFSTSTMYRILTSCSASIRKSLQGLDYISAEGGTAFDDLAVITDQLMDYGLDPCYGAKYQKSLKEGKQYLKTDFKVHVSEKSNTADHCLSYALSDEKEAKLQQPCDHLHDTFCQSCEHLKLTLSEIKDHIKLLSNNDDDILYRYQQAVLAIESWKSHLLRSVQQDKARTDVLELLDEESVLITQDWAMKFLPEKFRETQADWFGKRGISWHISVVVRKVEGKLQHQTLVHIVKTSPQESETVIWIMVHLLSSLKQEHPEICTAYFRQDNAGCYHSVALLRACPEISRQTGVTIKRVDFSDPQGGKGACDRKAASIKGHVRRYLNEGHDVATPEEFERAILSYGGLQGVRVALTNAADSGITVEGKWDGISTINNFQFDQDAATVWKSYNIGEGQKVMWNKLPVQVKVVPQVPAEEVKFSTGDFVTVTHQEKTEEDPRQNQGEDDEVDHDPVDDTNSELFPCPLQGCIASFKRHANLEHHLLYGKCKLRQEKYTLLDQAKLLYSQKVSEGTSKQPLLSSATSVAASTPLLCQGWALRQIKRTARFNENQRSYLDEKFDLGVISGSKADPAQVARDLRHARNDSGERRFNIDEFLTPQQIKSYFSRKAAKNKKAQSQDLETNNLAAEDHTAYCAARDLIVKECQLLHPIMYDTYNVCKLYAEEKLTKLTVALLHHICVFFDLDVEGLSPHRKAPYISLISTLVQSCTCCKR